MSPEEIERLERELQESIEAQELLRMKMSEAASIIKRQKEELNQLSVPEELVEAVKEFELDIPERMEAKALQLVSALSNIASSARIQIQEHNHYLKVTSDGFNYEREVLEKENQELSREKEYYKEEVNKLSNMLTQVKSKIGEKLKTESAEKEILLLEIKELKSREVEFFARTQQEEEEALNSQRLNEKLKKELDRLTSHLIQVETNHQQDILGLETIIDSLKAEISEVNREQKTWEDSINAEKLSKKEIQQALSLAQDEISRLNGDNEKLRMKSKEDLKCIDNLQMVLNEFQSARDSEIKLSLSRTLEKLDLALNQNQKLEEKIFAAEEKLKSFEFSSKDTGKLESLVSSKDLEIQKLKHDIASLQSHLSEAMRRLKSGLNSDIVDKKLISNLFVQFLSLPRGDTKKFEILDVISGILDLSTSDKVKIGLLNQKVDSPQESTFTDMWISFLYKEAGVLEEGH